MKSLIHTYKAKIVAPSISYRMLCHSALWLIFIFIFTSCKKNYLEIKPSKALVVPSTIKDFQGLLDETSVMNHSSPIIGEISSDDYYITIDNWLPLSEIERGLYIWSKDVVIGQGSDADWESPYRAILNANIAVDGLDKIKPSTNEQVAWNNAKGSALFHRAYNFYNLVQLYAPTYDKLTAATDPGIVLKMNSDVKETYARSTVQQTYDQIIKDLLAAEELLPVIPLYKTRPSKPAAHALLARIYLLMGDYDKAYQYADAALGSYSDLIDYNSLNAGASLPIQRFNKEVIFHYKMIGYSILITPTPLTDPALFQSYSENDLRKSVFYTPVSGGVTFKGFYSGDILNFSGIATDELYLIRAESAVRKGDKDRALSDLNTLLQNRWKTGTFVPYIAANATEALDIILLERRKELPFRGLRWSDLKRLNKEPRYAKMLSRTLDGQNYTLPPNDIRYVLPIPTTEIALSGIQQNPR